MVTFYFGRKPLSFQSSFFCLRVLIQEKKEQSASSFLLLSKWFTLRLLHLQQVSGYNHGTNTWRSRGWHRSHFLKFSYSITVNCTRMNLNYNFLSKNDLRAADSERAMTVRLWSNWWKYPSDGNVMNPCLNLSFSTFTGWECVMSNKNVLWATSQIKSLKLEISSLAPTLPGNDIWRVIKVNEFLPLRMCWKDGPDRAASSLSFFLFATFSKLSKYKQAKFH